jgi:hypothetical protein
MNNGYRTLYVDDVAVAQDAAKIFMVNWSDKGLTLGAAGNLEQDLFFSSLIDDVRIYDRAVEP